MSAVGRVMVHEAASEGFGSVADEYERARPDYPRGAVDRLAKELKIGASSRVLDLGAGTGKLTRMLTPLGARVVAVEPIASMREQLARVLPNLPLVAGVAEGLPFADGGFQAVVCAQAFHWFDGERALAENHRVLIPNGRLALLWNVKDESVSWVRALGDILRPHQARVPQETTGEWRDAFSASDLFGPLEEARFAHAQRLDAAGLVERYGSASYVATLPDAGRRDVLERIRRLADTHPDLSGKEEFEHPYVTELHWCTRR
ncbi:MAG: class I SAM-dependent methyltransferase [Actinomycetota bacterium]